MSEKLPTLRDVKSRYSPDSNPLMESLVVPVARRKVRSALAQVPLVDGNTGELVGTSITYEIEEMDDANFVKVFAAGISAAYELSRAGQRVFQSVLAEYERADMPGGFAACVALAWFDGGLSGRDIGMSEKTFNRGLRELLDKGFIAPRTVGLFWVNPSLFFKGDRVRFVKEYRRASRGAVTQRPAVAPPRIESTPTPPVVTPGDGVSPSGTKPRQGAEQSLKPAGGFRFGKKKKR